MASHSHQRRTHRRLADMQPLRRARHADLIEEDIQRHEKVEIEAFEPHASYNDRLLSAINGKDFYYRPRSAQWPKSS